MTKILIASKDLQFLRILSSTLFYNGFIVESAASLEMAYKLLNEVHFSLVLMDNDFPIDFSSYAYRPSTIVMGESYDECAMIEQMYSRMDDYILKPFGLSELKMIINRQLERKQLMARPLIFGDLRIDVAKSMVTVKDKIISLGKKEFEVLLILTRKAGKIVSRDQLITEQRTSILKKKLSSASAALQIKTISNVGYKLIAT